MVINSSVMSGLVESIKQHTHLKMVHTMPKSFDSSLDYYMKEYKRMNYRVFTGERSVI